MAAISYVDALLGQVLDALEEEGLTETTNIVLWGDHGFHLGDHTLWCKHSNFEQATRIPFMFAGPGVAKGVKDATPVELLDAFPTLFELAGVKASAQAEGTSLVPLLDGDAATTVADRYAVSQYQRGGKKSAIMGYSIRTDRYRYTEWLKGFTTDDAYDEDMIVGVELYDYDQDPGETKSFAEDRAYAPIAAGLKAQLLAHFARQRGNLAKAPGMGAVDVPTNTASSRPLAPAAAPRTSDRPNVLFIHTDDLGYFDLSLTGSKIYQTPNIDRLAGRGIRFKQAYTNYPRCTPSRYALMTGTYPVNEDYGHLTGIPQERNFAHLLNEAGYYSFYVGKWHLGHDDNSPTAFGFDDSYAAGHAGGIGSRFYPFNIKKNGKRHKEQVPDVEQDGKEGDYISDLMTAKTIDMLRAAPANEPFFAHLAYYSVHTPLESKDADRKRNAKEIAAFDYGDGPEYIEEGDGRRKMRQDDADYAGMVENVDENVGKLLDYLESSGQMDNTIIVFTSDHGGLSNGGSRWERLLATSNLPLRAGKGWVYEGGIRVPLIISWPAQLQPRVDEHSIVMGMDLYPTLLDLVADVKVPNIDGKSFEGVLTETDIWDERTVYWTSRKARPHSTGDYPMTAVRSGDHKLVHYDESGEVEVFDLSQDEGELNDISKQQPELTAALLDRMKSWKKEYLVPEKMKLKRK